MEMFNRDLRNAKGNAGPIFQQTVVTPFASQAEMEAFKTDVRVSESRSLLGEAKALPQCGQFRSRQMMLRAMLILLLLTFGLAAPNAHAEQADFYAALQLFKLSIECPHKPFYNPQSLEPIRGLESNQVQIDDQSIVVISTRRIEHHQKFDNTWHLNVQYDRARINFVDLQTLKELRVGYNESFIPRFSFSMSTAWNRSIDFAVCDEERANNAKTALEALADLSKAGDGHLAGLPEPPFPTRQFGTVRRECALADHAPGC